MNLLKESFIYKLFVAINTSITNLVSNSVIINSFLKEKDVTSKGMNWISLQERQNELYPE